MITINIPTDRGLLIVATQHIIRIEALDNYSRIIFLNRKPLVVAKVLHWFEDRLPQNTFCRIHKSHLVNCIYIEKINGNRGKTSATLTNGEMIDVSRRKRSLLYRNDLQLLIQRAA